MNHQVNSFLNDKYRDWVRDVTSLANPFILLLVPLSVMGLGKEFLVLLFTLAINEFLCSGIKYTFHRTRPNGQQYSNALEKIDAGSFPSLHASRITIVYLTLFFFINVLLIKILFLLVIALVAYSRIHLKKHFLSDVVAGIFIGIVLYYISQFFLGLT